MTPAIRDQLSRAAAEREALLEVVKAARQLQAALDLRAPGILLPNNRRGLREALAKLDERNP